MWSIYITVYVLQIAGLVIFLETKSETILLQSRIRQMGIDEIIV